MTRTAIVWFLIRKRPIYREGDTITMADELSIGLQELLRKARMEHDPDLLKEGVRVLSQALMEMALEEPVGAGRHERSPSVWGSATATGRGIGTPEWARSS